MGSTASELKSSDATFECGLRYDFQERTNLAEASV